MQIIFLWLSSISIPFVYASNSIGKFYTECIILYVPIKTHSLTTFPWGLLIEKALVDRSSSRPLVMSLNLIWPQTSQTFITIYERLLYMETSSHRTEPINPSVDYIPECIVVCSLLPGLTTLVLHTAVSNPASLYILYIYHADVWSNVSPSFPFQDGV